MTFPQSIAISVVFVLVAFCLGYAAGRLHLDHFRDDGDLEKRALEAAKSDLLRRVLDAINPPEPVDADLQLEDESADQDLGPGAAIIDNDTPAECRQVGFSTDGHS